MDAYRREGRGSARAAEAGDGVPPCAVRSCAKSGEGVRPDRTQEQLPSCSLDLSISQQDTDVAGSYGTVRLEATQRLEQETLKGEARRQGEGCRA